MRESIKRGLRLVGLDDVACATWALRRNLRTCCWNAGYRIAGAADGLPLPPVRLIFHATISREIGWFLHSGRISHSCICEALQRNGIQPDGLRAILDFGCGCGRVIRHWRVARETKLYGTDIDFPSIEWCKSKLSHLAEFQTNGLAPPLAYGSGKFDLVYAISVFTHLPEELQHDWMAELARVLKPLGVLLLTLHGWSRLPELTPEERRRFDAGQMVIRVLSSPGDNLFGAYHPTRYVSEQLAKGYHMVDFIPAGLRDANQDVYLLRKLAA